MLQLRLAFRFTYYRIFYIALFRISFAISTQSSEFPAPGDLAKLIFAISRPRGNRASFLSLPKLHLVPYFKQIVFQMTRLPISIKFLRGVVRFSVSYEFEETGEMLTGF